MGDPGSDLDRLRQVLEIASAAGLSLARVRVGGIELACHAPHPPPGRTETADGEAQLSPEEQRKERLRELEEIMYAASDGDLLHDGVS